MVRIQCNNPSEKALDDYAQKVIQLFEKRKSRENEHLTKFQ